MPGRPAQAPNSPGPISGLVVRPQADGPRAELGTRRMRVGMIAPVPGRLNPYIPLLKESVERTGAVEYDLHEWFSPRWFFTHWRELDILHIHWLEHVYAARTRRRMWKKLALFVAAMAWCRLRGIKIVYTVHNLDPHSRSGRVPYQLSSRLVFACADAIHVHEESTRREVARRYGRVDGVFTIPHGNYVGAYPNECTAQQSRRALELEEDSFVYLFLGQVRANKGLEDLIGAFSRLEDANTRLVIAGWPPDEDYGRTISRMASQDKRIRMRMTFVPDGELQVFFNASDVCVLPYRQFTSSGVVLLALSFGRPVVAPKLGTFAEILDEGTGVLYEGGDLAALVEALQSARRTVDYRSSKMALDRAREFDWAPIGAEHVRLYQTLRR